MTRNGVRVWAAAAFANVSRQGKELSRTLPWEIETPPATVEGA